MTSEHLGGASRWELAAFGLAVWELAAFGLAVMEHVLDTGVDEWTALAVAWDGGAWREFVAERCLLAWQLAERLTREERERRPLTPGSHPD